MMTVKKIQINEDNEGRRLDNFLISIFSTVPKSKIYNKLIKIRKKSKLNYEKVFRKDYKYDLILVVKYNYEKESLKRNMKQNYKKDIKKKSKE